MARKRFEEQGDWRAMCEEGKREVETEREERVTNWERKQSRQVEWGRGGEELREESPAAVEFNFGEIESASAGGSTRISGRIVCSHDALQRFAAIL